MIPKTRMEQERSPRNPSEDEQKELIKQFAKKHRIPESKVQFERQETITVFKITR